MKKPAFPKFILILCAVLTLAVGITQLSVSLFIHSKNDQLLRNSEYNCVFLSMFPIDTFQEKDFSYFRADDVLLLKYVIPNYQVLKRYLKDVQSSENEMHSIYLGIDPKKITASQILELQEAFPDVTFEIIPTYRRLSQWMKDLHPEKTFNAYLDMAEKLLGNEHIHVYSFFAQEWLISDNANYVTGNLLTESVAHRVYVYADTAHHCNFTPNDIADTFNDFSRLLSETKSGALKNPDLSAWDVILLGDSVIGNFVEHDSIPSLISAFSGARTYNCGLGGATAGGEETNSIGYLLNAYLSKDLSSISEDTAIYSGLQKRWADEALASQQKTVFVLHFGLNDYLSGFPVDNPEDSYDINTFCGAMRKAIETLQTERPDAKILLIAPNAITCHNAGTRIWGANGAPLADYVNALLQIGKDYGIPVQDDFHEIISAQRADYFLEDQLHPNEYGRYKIAKELIRQIKELDP